MAQYFDFPVKIPVVDDAIADVTMAKWSLTDPVLAVATRNKKLWVVQEEVGDVAPCLRRALGALPEWLCSIFNSTRSS